MPQFESLPRNEAIKRTTTGKRSQAILEYREYIDRLTSDQAGKITPSLGETKATVRRRLGTAVKQSGKNITIKVVGDDIYFWEERRRGGRPRKTPAA